MPWSILEKNNINLYASKNSDEKLYTVTVRETLKKIMKSNDKIFLMGQGINDKNGCFGMTDGLFQEFGTERVFDTPISENGVMGIGIGAAMQGRRPIYFHNRPDFLFMAMDQIVNHAAKISYMSGGQYKVPLVIWATAGQGWGSAAQHTQTLHGTFMHIPGLKVVVPTNSYDIKGILNYITEIESPVLILDHRRVQNSKSFVPDKYYTVPIGRSHVCKKGNDVTLLGISAMIFECVEASDKLEKMGISAEVIDAVSIKPFDYEQLFCSVKKTGRLVVVDNANKNCGSAAEISATVTERLFDKLKCPIQRVAWPDVPVPASYVLENSFYPTSKDIVNAVMEMKID